LIFNSIAIQSIKKSTKYAAIIALRVQDKYIRYKKKNVEEFYFFHVAVCVVMLLLQLNFI
jgi:hypothetical protein